MVIDPAKAALLAMDFEPYILATLPEQGGVVENVARAIAALRAAGGRIAYVRVAFTPEELKAFPAHSAMGQRVNANAEKVLIDAPTTQIDARLAPQTGDIMVRKRRVGPFSTTDLDAQLRAAGVDTIIVCGIHSSGCVLTGVREANDLDYRIIVLSDGCTDPDSAVHEFLIGKIFPRQATVMSVADFQQKLNKR